MKHNIACWNQKDAASYNLLSLAPTNNKVENYPKDSNRFYYVEFEYMVLIEADMKIQT